MRTDPSDPLAATLHRLRAWTWRARRWALSLGPGGRLALAAALLGALTPVVYLAAPTDSDATAWVAGGREFPRGDQHDALRLLATKQIAALADGRRIEVPRDRLAEAEALLAQHDLGGDPVALLDRPVASPLFAHPAEVEEARKRQHERYLAAEIEGYEPTLAATVLTFPPARSRGLARRPDPMRATVLLRADGDRSIPEETYRRVIHLMLGLVPDLRAEGLSVYGNGEPYLVVGQPALGERSQAKAREDELRGEILRQLDWIEAVRVTVRVESPPAPTPPRAESPGPPPTAVATNAPLGAIDDPPPALAPKGPTPAHVLIQVPASHYARALDEEHKPSAEDVRLIVARVDSAIRQAVEIVVPEAERGEVTITRIPVAEPARPPASATASRRLPAERLALVGAASVVLAASAVALGRWLTTRRRPSAGPVVEARRPRVDLGDGDVTGPSGRVRELIRLDPAAAAGVLGRWISQGGGEAA